MRAAGAKTIGQRSILRERHAAESSEGVSLGGGEEGFHFLGLPHAVVAENIHTVFVGDGTGTIGTIDFGNKFQSADAQGFD
jgi:hypothetical protein